MSNDYPISKLNNIDNIKYKASVINSYSYSYSYNGSDSDDESKSSECSSDTFYSAHSIHSWMSWEMNLCENENFVVDDFYSAEDFLNNSDKFKLEKSVDGTVWITCRENDLNENSFDYINISNIQ